MTYWVLLNILLSDSLVTAAAASILGSKLRFARSSVFGSPSRAAAATTMYLRLVLLVSCPKHVRIETSSSMIFLRCFNDIYQLTHTF